MFDYPKPEFALLSTRVVGTHHTRIEEYHNRHRTGGDGLVWRLLGREIFKPP